MGLLDFDENYKPPFTPKEKYRAKDNKDELEAEDRPKIVEDFSDSRYLDY